MEHICENCHHHVKYKVSNVGGCGADFEYIVDERLLKKIGDGCKYHSQKVVKPVQEKPKSQKPHRERTRFDELELV